MGNNSGCGIKCKLQGDRSVQNGLKSVLFHGLPLQTNGDGHAQELVKGQLLNCLAPNLHHTQQVREDKELNDSPQTAIKMPGGKQSVVLWWL